MGSGLNLQRVRQVSTAVAISTLISCGSPIQPSPRDPRVTGVQPAIGSTLGQTSITITGEAFAAGATVTIGGVPATGVVVEGETRIRAVTAQRAPGTVDVVVTVGGRQGVLAGAFSYVVVSAGPNAPPAIASVAARGPRPNQPAGMADLSEAIAVAAAISDAETPVDALSLGWSATLGGFEGTGANLTWRAPASLAETPATAVLTLTVTERYFELDGTGQPVPREHRVTRDTSVRVHDSAREIADLARQFLTWFSMSSVPPAQVVSGFSTTCDGGRGRRDELLDVELNRCVYTVTGYNVGNTSPTVDFGGSCSIADRFHRADGCARVPVAWEDIVNPGAMSCPNLNGIVVVPGTRGSTAGIDMVTAVYESGQWRLCHSDYIAGATSQSRVGR